MKYYKFRINGSTVNAVTEGVVKTDKIYSELELDHIIYEHWQDLYYNDYEDDEVEPECDAHIKEISEKEFLDSGLHEYNLENVW